MQSLLNRLSIRNRIWIIVFLLIGSTVLGSVIDVLMLRETLSHERELKTRQLVESSFGVLTHLHDLQMKGEFTEADAQAAAIGTIKAMRYDEKEYFWLNDLGTPFPKMIMHPTVSSLDGQVLDSETFNCATAMRVETEEAFTPTNGKLNLFVAFSEVIKKGEAGYVTYNWPKPTAGGGVTGELFPKLSYVKKFEPWGWVIGTGIYIDDVDAAVRKQAGRNVMLVAGIGLVLLFLASLIARSITQPLRRTVATMRTIGDGALSQRLPVEGNCEIAELSAGFNEMLGHLEARDAELARQREHLEETVANRTLELRDTNLELEKELAERQRIDHAMRESRIRMRALLDASDEEVLLLDPHGLILEINAFAAQRFGLTPETMTGKDFFDFIPADLVATRAAAVQHVASTGEAMNLKDKRAGISFDSSLYPVKDEAGGVESVAVYAKDVTEQQRAKAIEDIFRHLDAVLLKWQMNLEAIAQIFCDEILPVFDLTAVWIGRAEKDGRLTMLASAESGEKTCLASLRETDLRWDDQPGCYAFASEVIRSGSRQVIANDPYTSRAALMLPLTMHGETWGVFVCYGEEARQFDAMQFSLRLAAIAGRLGVSLEAAAQQEWLTLLETALAGVGNGVFITDVNASILWVNRSFAQLSGYASEEVIGKTPRMFNSGVQDEDFYQQFWQTIRSGRTWHGDIVNQRRDGTHYTVHQTVTPLLIGSDQVSHFVAILEDISERKAAEEHIRHAANFDLLTDLPNRGLFFDRLGQALIAGRRDGVSGALLFLDLDHFKEVNDQFGHAAGDELLIAVAQRLRSQVRESDTVARLGGDEFTIILPSLHDKHDAIHVAEKILAAILLPFFIAEQDVSIGVSIGIAYFPEHGNVVEPLLNAADHAMYLAKNGGRNRYFVAGGDAAYAKAVSGGISP